MKEKSFHRGNQMDLFGKLVWGAACRKAAHSTHPIAPLTLLAETLCLSEKQTRQRLNSEESWLQREVKWVLRDFKDQDLYDYCEASLKNSFKS